MGCIHCSASEMYEQESNVQPEQEKIYSWSNRRRNSDESEYLIENLKDEKVSWSPSKCDQIVPLTISNCMNCLIASCNAHSTVNVSNCHKCIIFLGPTNGSVNIHDCTDCDIMCAVMQFRTRDCHNMFISLHCATQPSIESSSGLTFCPFVFSYPQLGVFNNKWFQIFDFSAGESDEENWTLVRGDNVVSSVERRFSGLTSLLELHNGTSDEYLQVPIIEGHSRSSLHDSRLVLFFLPLERKEEEKRTEMRGINLDEDKGRYKWRKIHEFIGVIQKSEETYIINTRQVSCEYLKGVHFAGMKVPEPWSELVVVHIGSSCKVQNEICSILQRLSLYPNVDYVSVTNSTETTRQLLKEIFSK